MTIYPPLTDCNNFFFLPKEIGAGEEEDGTGSNNSNSTTPSSPAKSPDSEKPERPPIPIRVSSRSPNNGILSLDQLEKEYADIARYKIFQLAGKIFDNFK